jgi:hypothetical protein
MDCSLPPLSQPLCSPEPQKSAPSKKSSDKTSAQNPSPENISLISSLLPSIKQYLATLLPIFIKLFLSTSLSTKVECFSELATLLQIETPITNLIAELGYSSLTNSQI